MFPSRPSVYIPFLQGLAEHDGRMASSDMREYLLTVFPEVTESDRNRSIPSGQANKWQHEVRWIKQELVIKGYVQRYSPRGIWQITDLGRAHLSADPRSWQGQESLIRTGAPPRRPTREPIRVLRDHYVDPNPNQEETTEIGLAGELLVIEAEARELRASGRKDLANRIVHVSRQIGPSAGYDIDSFRADGTPIQIEVKTTTGEKTTPFYITRHEMVFAKEHQDSYVICRVYDLSHDRLHAKFYVCHGLPEEHFTVSPFIYEARR